MIAGAPSEVGAEVVGTDVVAAEATGMSVPQSFWRAACRFPTGVSVLTLGRGEGMYGITVSAFTAVSREPALVSVCLRSTSSSVGLVGESESFAVNVLAGGQATVARHFANRDRGGGSRQFDGIPWRRELGLPVLDGAVCWLRCVPVRTIPAGDHHVVLAEVQAALVADGAPLLYFAGRLHPGAIHTQGDSR